MKKLCLTIAIALVSVTAFAFPEYTSLPAAMSEVDDFQHVVLTFPEGTELTVTDESGFYFEDSSYAEDDVTVSTTVNGNILTVTPTSALTTDKWWALCIDSDCLTASGTSNPDIHISFKLKRVEAAQFPNYEIDPGRTSVNSLSSVTLTFADGTALVVAESTEKATMSGSGKVIEGEMSISGSVVSFDFASVPNGNNTLSIPAGLFTANGVSNPEITRNYTLKKSFPEYTTDPEDFSEVENFKQMVITFPENTVIEIKDEDGFYFEDPNYRYDDIVAIVSVEGNKLIVKPETTPTPDMFWGVFIDSGAFSGDGVSNPEMYIRFKPTGGKPGDVFPKYDLDPSFSNVESLREVTFTFPEGTALAATASTEKATVKPLSGAAITGEMVITDNVLKFKFDGEIEGLVVMTIPAGIYTANEINNPELTMNYIVKPVFPTFKVSPADRSTIDDVDNIMISFAEGTSVDFTANKDQISLEKVENVDDEETDAITIDQTAEIDGANIIINPTSILSKGSYRLYVPVGAIKANGVTNPYVILTTFTLTKNQSGVGTIISDMEITVFDLNGSLIYKGNAEDFKTKESKIYIVNGKKVAM